jgi:pyruvate/2-oxoglutarate dehydrogenase complex dihydrolipoamide acyltransferase (E2) component
MRPTRRIQERTVEREARARIGDRIKASPLAKRLAREHKVDLSLIPPTGSGAVITKDDVLAFLEKPPAMFEEGDEIIPLVGWRKTMAERMTHGVQTMAQITTITEVDVTDLGEFRKRLQEEGKPRISYTAFIVKAVAQALKEYPLVNSSLVDDKVVIKNSVNIGLAVAREKQGLIIPVIHRAEQLDLYETSKAVIEAAEKARSGKLSLKDITGSTFTITNPGMLGVTLNTPLISPPNAAILGVGAFVKRPVVREDQIVIRTMAFLCLTYDHRILDGAPSIAFLQRVKQFLQNPAQLIE